MAQAQSTGLASEEPRFQHATTFVAPVDSGASERTPRSSASARLHASASSGPLARSSNGSGGPKAGSSNESLYDLEFETGAAERRISEALALRYSKAAPSDGSSGKGSSEQRSGASGESAASDNGRLLAAGGGGSIGGGVPRRSHVVLDLLRTQEAAPQPPSSSRTVTSDGRTPDAASAGTWFTRRLLDACVWTCWAGTLGRICALKLTWCVSSPAAREREQGVLLACFKHSAKAIVALLTIQLALHCVCIVGYASGIRGSSSGGSGGRALAYAVLHVVFAVSVAVLLAMACTSSRAVAAYETHAGGAAGCAVTSPAHTSGGGGGSVVEATCGDAAAAGTGGGSSVARGFEGHVAGGTPAAAAHLQSGGGGGTSTSHIADAPAPAAQEATAMHADATPVPAGGAAAPPSFPAAVWYVVSGWQGCLLVTDAVLVAWLLFATVLADCLPPPMLVGGGRSGAFLLGECHGVDDSLAAAIIALGAAVIAEAVSSELACAVMHIVVSTTLVWGAAAASIAYLHSSVNAGVGAETTTTSSNVAVVYALVCLAWYLTSGAATCLGSGGATTVPNVCVSTSTPISPSPFPLPCSQGPRTRNPRARPGAAGAHLCERPVAARRAVFRAAGPARDGD